MTSFDAYDLISLWEAERDLGDPERALLLLGMACPDESREQLAHLSIGERDRILYHMRQRLFGDQLEGLVTCTQCDEDLELGLCISELLASVPQEASETRGSLVVGEVTVEFRLPNTDDAIHAARCADTAQARRLLLQRCVLAVDRDGAPASTADIDDITLARIFLKMETLDPLADVQLSLECTECGHSESILLDIASYLWRELATEAVRLMEDVRALAHEYGWREVDILAMSGRRRHFYLQQGAA